jgi:hypothetical protein
MAPQRAQPALGLQDLSAMIMIMLPWARGIWRRLAGRFFRPAKMGWHKQDLWIYRDL